MSEETSLGMMPLGVLRMAGYPIQLMDPFKLNGEDLSYSEFRKQTSTIRRNLRELWRNNKSVQEAIWISSENLHSSLSDKLRDVEEDIPRNRDDRRWDGLVTKFLLRFCYKNDTTSFFGPSSYVSFKPDQRESVVGNLENTVANREHTATRTASWVDYVPPRLIEEYRFAKGVDQKKKIMKEIVSKTKGERHNRPWRWYSERTPVYDLCPANANISIGGNLLDDILTKGKSLHAKVKTFNFLMYQEAVDKGLYKKVHRFLSEKTETNDILRWIEYIYNEDISSLDDIKNHMLNYGKSVFEAVFYNWARLDMAKGPKTKVFSPFFSPDFMIHSKSRKSINEGDYELVASDLHGTLTCFLNTFSHSMDRPDKENMVRFLNKEFFDKYSYYFPSNSIPDTVNWLDTFEVIRDLSGLQVFERDGELAYNNNNAYVEFFFTDVLSKIVPLGCFGLDEFMPEGDDKFVDNEVILKRRSIHINSQDFLDFVQDQPEMNKTERWYNLFTRTKKYMAGLGFTNTIFIKPDCEYKPLALDINNPFCCEILQSYAKRTEGITLQEMLPSRNGLWLENENGNYTSELRVSFFERGT